jgi:hypothetical protein
MGTLRLGKRSTPRSFFLFCVDRHEERLHENVLDLRGPGTVRHCTLHTVCGECCCTGLHEENSGVPYTIVLFLCIRVGSDGALMVPSHAYLSIWATPGPSVSLSLHAESLSTNFQQYLKELHPPY